ncbi:MAG: helix-turn-helix domain-containing protein [Opitutales bacterium]
MKKALKIELNASDQEVLQSVIKSPTSPVRSVERARIVLLASEGHENNEIAMTLGIHRDTASRWRNRFVEEGVNGLWKDAGGRGRKPK